MLRSFSVISLYLGLLLFFKSVSTEEFNLSGYPGLGYIIEVIIGSPPQKLQVLVDTGSSTLAIASRTQPEISKYFYPQNSSSIHYTREKIEAKYTQGRWSAQLADDYVQFPSINLAPAVRTDISLITDSNDFYMNGSGWQGMVGLAYPAISAHGSKLSSKPWLSAVDKARGKTTSFLLKLCGIWGLKNTTHHGALQLIDDSYISKNKNRTYYTPILRERWFEVGILNIRIVKDSSIKTNETPSKVLLDKLSNNNIDETVCQKLNFAKSIVDSGTTNIRLTNEVLRPIVDEIKSAAWSPYTLVSDEFWYHGEAACWPEPQTWSLPKLAIDMLSDEDNSQYFTIELPPESYIRLVSFHTSSKNSDVWEYFYTLGLQEGASTILGVAAIEGLEVTFNKSSGRIGFQTTNCGPAVRITGPHNTTQNLTDVCKLTKQIHDVAKESIQAAQWAAAAALTAALALVLYLLAPFINSWIMKKLRRSSTSVSISRAALVDNDVT